MPYEKSLFGDGSDAGSGNVKGNVSNHFGPRDTGGTQGITKTEGSYKEAAVSFDGDEGPLYDEHWIPTGSLIMEVVPLGITGSIATATVGEQDISGATGTIAGRVSITEKGKLEITGPTAGKVVVKFVKLAGEQGGTGNALA